MEEKGNPTTTDRRNYLCFCTLHSTKIYPGSEFVYIKHQNQPHTLTDIISGRVLNFIYKNKKSGVYSTPLFLFVIQVTLVGNGV